MNDSERLLEVLDTCEGIIRNLGYTYDDIVDYLIANGVTVQKHGRWIDRGWDGDWSWQIDGRGHCWHIYECSECGARNCGGPKINYCPNCGAKMDEETPDDTD